MAKKNSKTSDSVVTGLVEYLSETGQNEILGEVTGQLENLLDESKGADKILVTSCVSINRDQSEKIQNIINRLIKIRLPVENRVDKKLLGGLTIQVGDWYLDASISSELQNIKNQIS